MLTFVSDGAYALLALNIPHPDSLVIGAGQQERAIHRYRQTCHQISAQEETDCYNGCDSRAQVQNKIG